MRLARFWFVAATVVAVMPAWAQVSLSGSLDVLVRRDSGQIGGPAYSLSPGGARSSRLTFQSKENLGDGWIAHVVLEAAMQPDTGTVGSGLTYFSRVATVNIGSDRTGYISFGRQFTPIQDVSASPSNDPFGGAWLGGIATVYSKTTNANNGVLYHYGLSSAGSVAPVPPKGFAVLALWSPGEAGLLPNGSQAPGTSGNQIGFGSSYGAGPVWIGASFHQISGNSASINAAAPTTDRPRLRQSHIGAAYDFGIARLHAGLNRGSNDVTGTAEVDRNAWHVGVTAPITTVSAFRFLYGSANDRTAANRDLSTIQVAFLYNLSLRTALYINGGQVKNSGNSSVVLTNFQGSVPLGGTARTLALGLRHNF